MFFSPVITFDGPSGSGKSSLCKLLSKKIKWNFLKSGMIYRVIAIKLFNNKIELSEKKIINFLKNLNFINSIDLLKKEIKKEKYLKFNFFPKIYKILSIFSNFPKIRKFLFKIQQMFRQPPGLIAEGRDMGTVVFSDALLKFFLDANLKDRAYRRTLELQKNGFNVTFKDILFSMWKRDNQDYNRNISPLIPPKNSIIIDSTYLNLKQILKIILTHIKKNSIIYSIIKKNIIL
ncbi:(d)CMP kinase [Buchnera aphidicola]|uniref:(d)CMP kinase n=1 Tax=Buchnera aphidicola TaxID=9 RepID=UPI0031B81D08